MAVVATLIWACVCVIGFAGSAVAVAARCPNAKLRAGPSANLPDCRAYELVTPTDLGRTQDMSFTGEDKVLPSIDGERLALRSLAPLEPNPTLNGAHAFFTRTPSGWQISSATISGEDGDWTEMSLVSPDLSQVAMESFTSLNDEETSPKTFEVGPVGGPYAIVAKDIPVEDEEEFLGANAGTASVPALSHVLFTSTDHALLPLGAERTVAETALAGAPDLYEWTDGHLRLVDVEGEDVRLKLVDPCGALLGAGSGDSYGGGGTGAVSADGSKIFFTGPPASSPCGEGPEPPRLYMRVDGRETVEVSAPQGVELEPSERHKVTYDGATPNGSNVFFDTTTPLMAGESTEDKLFDYDTEKPEGERLTLIAPGFSGTQGPSSSLVVSEEGSAIYYTADGSIHRYEVGSGQKGFVGTPSTPFNFDEPSYATPDGDFLVFVSGPEGVRLEGQPEPEPRGVGHQELYRYDALDGSVMCVSCGEGVAPGEPGTGEMLEPANANGAHVVLATEDETPPFVQMSENGQEVFFETTAQLVPQDTNNTEYIGTSTSGTPGMDVYEWEADGAGECELSQGCTYLISSGEEVGPAHFLGASRNGSDVFFATAAQLLPQATPEFTNIYDARVDGGFPPPSATSPCLTCHGVGSPPPLFSPGASLTFAGAGDSATSSFTTVATHQTAARCAKGRRRSHGKCVKPKNRRKTRAKKAGSRRRGGGS